MARRRPPPRGRPGSREGGGSRAATRRGSAPLGRGPRAAVMRPDQGRRQRRAQGHGAGRLPTGRRSRGSPIDPVEAQPRQVYFFDTPDLALNRAGVVVRARRIQGGRGDTVVKLRPVVPAELPADLRRQADFNVEVDVLPGGFVCSASFKGRSTGQDVRDAVAGTLPLRRLFSKTQRAFYREHAPDGLDLDAPGPARARRSCSRSASRDQVSGARRSAPERLLVAEIWLYPDGSRILELSTKCLPAEAFARRAPRPGPTCVARGHRHRRRPADQDQDGPRVLRRPSWRGRGRRPRRSRVTAAGPHRRAAGAERGPDAALRRRDRRRRGSSWS